ncbi:hypothetical protein K6Y31_20355 [Motilimonas cestriensis]|uniref:Uncharacterized protein n=1 Tax=Motilimonas cestriensis TaxID=2742685 RepID=A0ABS8WF63_9GAMM|nr:hypothetical protein [Motilimonas cestriensis]MCE2597130.1 hypothetical protein [Motilimonas cestriensis]
MVNADISYSELVHIAAYNLKNGDLYRALETCKKGRNIVKPDHKLNLMHASILAQVGMFEEAIEMYGEILSAEADNLLAKFQLGVIHYVRSSYDIAASTWVNMNMLTPIVDGLNYLANGETDKAVELLKQGMSSNTLYPDINSDVQRLLLSIQGKDFTDNSELEVDFSGNNLNENEKHEPYSDNSTILSIYRSDTTPYN